MQSYRFTHSKNWLFFGSSALFAGLALLTKGPALILLPYTGLLMFWVLCIGKINQLDSARSLLRPGILLALIWQSMRLYALWLVLACAVIFVLWPALWVTPGYALERYIAEISDNGGRPNGDGQFFFGQAIADPGLAFYPVADLFRSTPATLIGWLLGLFAVLRRWTRRRPASATGHGADRRAADDQVLSSFSAEHVLFALAIFVLFWTAVMLLGPKKFDRYVLPTWPALLILAGAGWAWALEALWRLRKRLGRFLAMTLATLVLLGEMAQLGWYHPYYLSYYNPLLGGGRMAQHMFLIGWGEGMEQVGTYLRSRTDLQYGPVLSALGATLQPFVPVDVRDVEDFGKVPANYAVVYLESVQRAANPELYARLQTTIPLRTITIHGIDYAQIYQLPRPYAQASDIQFGDALRLRGFTLEKQGQRLLFTPAWDVRAAPSAEYHVFLHLLNEQGQRSAQIDVSPGGGDAPSTREWQPGQQFAVPLPLDLPAGLAAGRYQLVMGLYDVATGARVVVQGGDLANPALAGDNAVLLRSIELP